MVVYTKIVMSNHQHEDCKSIAWWYINIPIQLLVINLLGKPQDIFNEKESSKKKRVADPRKRICSEASTSWVMYNFYAWRS